MLRDGIEKIVCAKCEQGSGKCEIQDHCFHLKDFTGRIMAAIPEITAEWLQETSKRIKWDTYWWDLAKVIMKKIKGEI